MVTVLRWLAWFVVIGACSGTSAPAGRPTAPDDPGLAAIVRQLARATLAQRGDDAGEDALRQRALLEAAAEDPAAVLATLGKLRAVARPADPTRAFTVTLFDAQHRPVAARTFESRLVKWTWQMPPGSYPFEVHDDGRLVQSGTLVFGATPSTLEIR